MFYTMLFEGVSLLYITTSFRMGPSVFTKIYSGTHPLSYTSIQLVVHPPFKWG